MNLSALYQSVGIFRVIFTAGLVVYFATAAGIGAPAQTNVSKGLFTPAHLTPLPVPTQMHGCAVVGSRLYLFGGDHASGSENDLSNVTLSAEIKSTGELGSWREERKLPNYRTYISNSIEVVNNRIYILGGNIADKSNATNSDIGHSDYALWTAVQSDGTLGPWQKSEAFELLKGTNLSTCSSDEHLYVMGGLSAKAVRNETAMCDFAPDGSPRNWRLIAKLPTPLWFHGSAIQNGRLYVWGGLTEPSNKSVNSQVFSAEVAPDGNLTPWRNEPPMQQPVFGSANCGFNDHLISVAGRMSGAIPINDILFARIENGKASAWTSLHTDVEARAFHALGLDRSRGWIYVVGGHQKTAPGKAGTVVDHVRAFRLAPPAAAGQTKVSAPAANTTMSAADAVQAATAEKPALLFFGSPEVPASVRFEQSVLNTPEFKALSSGFFVGYVDSSRDMDFNYRYNVFRVPSMAMIGAGGKTIKASTRMTTMEDVKAFLQSK